MNKRQLMELEFSRKKYDQLPTEEIRDKVMELEKSLDGKLNIWDDEQTYAKYQMVNSLNLSDKRLLLVFSIFDGSVPKTATYFSVSRRTILNNVQRIKDLLTEKFLYISSEYNSNILNNESDFKDIQV